MECALWGEHGVGGAWSGETCSGGAWDGGVMGCRSMGWEHGVVQWFSSLEAVGLTACERPGRENLKSGRTRLPRLGLEKQTRITVQKDDQELSAFFPNVTPCEWCVCGYVFLCVWKSEVNLRHVPRLLSTLLLTCFYLKIIISYF